LLSREVLSPRCEAEFHKATHVLMHEPGQEVFFGLLHAKASLYESPFDLLEAVREHREYVLALKDSGVTVHLVRDLLLQGTVDIDNRKMEGEELETLRSLARNSLKYEAKWPDVDNAELECERHRTLQTLHPSDLFDIVVLRPTIVLEKRDGVIRAIDYKVDPLCNLFFTRDQCITTDREVILARMAEPIRQPEVLVIKAALSKLGVEPVEVLNGPDTLEGGDFMPAGQIAFIGVGLRTNISGVKTLMRSGALEYSELVVVKDPVQLMEQMHLDTYFNVIASDKVLLRASRFRSPNERPKVDIYEFNGTGYDPNPAQLDVDFVEFLQGRGFNIIEIPNNEQLNYGVNVLCIGPDHVIGSVNSSGRYPLRFLETGVTADLISMNNIRLGYGSNRCMTQVLRREP